MEIQTYVLGCNAICAFYRTGEHDCSDKCPLRNMECGSLMNEDDTIQDPLNAERAAAAEKIILDFMAGYVRTNHNNPLPSENKRPGMGLTFPQDDEKTNTGIYTLHGLMQSPAASQPGTKNTREQNGRQYRRMSMQRGPCDISTFSCWAIPAMTTW